MKFSFTKNPEKVYFYNKSKSNKRNLAGGRGRGGCVARFSDIYFKRIQIQV